MCTMYIINYYIPTYEVAMYCISTMWKQISRIMQIYRNNLIQYIPQNRQMHSKCNVCEYVIYFTYL